MTARYDLLLFVVLAAIVAVVWVAGRPAAVFVVRIRDGRPSTAHGTATPAFLNFVGELCDNYSIGAGEIRGVARGRRIALWFSDGLPAGFRQQLRNWWGMSGWPAPRRLQ
jgi:hypothetical protein